MSDQDRRPVRFTRAEAVETLRALELISQEDVNCDVNMDKASVAAKASALLKLERAFGLMWPEKRMAQRFKNAKSVDPRTGDSR